MASEIKEDSPKWLSKEVSRPGVPNGRIVVEPSFWQLKPEQRAETEKEMQETAYMGFGKLDTPVTIAVDAATKQKMLNSRPPGWNTSNYMRSCLRCGVKLNGTLAKLKEGSHEAVQQIDSRVVDKLKGLLEVLAS